MSDTEVRPATGFRARYTLTPWWGKVIAIFVVSRIVTTALLLVFAAMQDANAWTDAAPDYFSFASLWDGHWYYLISVVGYPADLPLTDAGQVAENAWAFMPGYPVTVAALAFITGIPFAVTAVFVSTAFALGTSLVFYRLLVKSLPPGTALFSVVLFCFAPLSPILQVAYAESMHLFFLAVALLLLVERRYVLLLPVIAVMSLTRPSGLAFALALLLHVVYRWVVRARQPFPAGERLASVVAAAFSALMGIAWTLVAALTTGSPSAYTDTELAWRSAWVGVAPFVPFAGWIQGANWWVPAPLGPVLLGLVVAGFGVVLFTPAVRRLGPDLRLWTVSYVVYLLAVFFPQSSTFRLLVPLFPLLGVVAQPRSVAYRVILVLIFIAGQVGWIYIAWWVDGYDWTPP